MLGPFHVGDQPADALDIVVSRTSDDTPLSGFDAATIEFWRPSVSGLDSQTMAAQLVQPDVVRAAWMTNPFVYPGLHKVRAVLTGVGSSEKTAWVRFWVRS